jgi:hypothetical protein
LIGIVASRIRAESDLDHFDYDTQEIAPDEPMPEPRTADEAASDNDDDTWIDLEDQANTSGEVLYQHFLAGRDSNKGSSKSRPKDPQDYATRLERERTNWEGQEESLGRAFMEYQIHGPKLEEKGDGMDWFTCKVFDINGTRKL